MFQRLKIDRVVAYTLANQAINVLIAPILLWLVARHLSPVEQGYYYTFGGLLALQTLLEMGFSQCILQFAGHEAAFLEWKGARIMSGDEVCLDRLRSLAVLGLKWYGIAAAALLLVLAAAGYLMFANRGGEVAWRLAWGIASVATCVSLAVQPVWAILDGVHQRVWTARYRATISGCKNLTICLGLYLGWKLNALGIAIAVQAVLTVVLLPVHWSGFLRQLLHRAPLKAQINWLKEIWPFQWRIAVSWISGYMIFSALNPIVFRIAGAAEAGRFGITFSLFQTVGAVGTAWVSSRYPVFGQYVARKEYTKLHAEWRALTWRAIAVTGLVSMAALIGLQLLQRHYAVLGGRFLPVAAALALGVGAVVNTYIQSLALYLRAHKEEPFLPLSVCNALLILVAVPISAAYFGANGAAVGFVACTLAILPYARHIFAQFIRRRAALPAVPAQTAPEGA